MKFRGARWIIQLTSLIQSKNGSGVLLEILLKNINMVKNTLLSMETSNFVQMRKYMLISYILEWDTKTYL